MIGRHVHRLALAGALGSLLAAGAAAQDTAAPSPPPAPPAPQAAPPAPEGAQPDLRPRRGMRAQLLPRMQAGRPGGMMVLPGPQNAPRLRLGPEGMLPGAEGPRLGVTVEETPDGVKVTEVSPDSLAQSAGVAADDIVLRIGENRIHGIDDIRLALAAYHPGEAVKIVVIRAGQGLVELSGTLPEPPAPPRGPAADGFRGGFLGVQMAPEAPDGAPGAAAPDAGPGVPVAGVVEDSAAWFAGLQEGDHLLALDGKELSSSEDLVGAVSGKEPGTLVELRYRRNGEDQTTKVRLGHRNAPGVLNFGAPGGMTLPGGPGFSWNTDDDLDGPGMPEDHDQFLPGLHQKLREFFGNDFHSVVPTPPAPAPRGTAPGPGGPGIGAPGPDLRGHSYQVIIEDDQMTVERDGQVEHYHRDTNGNWVRDDGDSSAAQPR